MAKLGYPGLYQTVKAIITQVGERADKGAVRSSTAQGGSAQWVQTKRCHPETRVTKRCACEDRRPWLGGTATYDEHREMGNLKGVSRAPMVMVSFLYLLRLPICFFTSWTF
jgi:hypothetical protein